MICSNRHGLYYIKDVSEFLNVLKQLMDKDATYVYRGEGKYYSDSSCLPNLHRKINLNEYPDMEKKVLEKVRSEGFDNNTSYILTAIEAQHGGFPSRLLDVTYNSLIALHFAVTPFYTQSENENDKNTTGEVDRKVENIERPDENDGTVFMIRVEDMYIPSSELVEEFYSKKLLDPNSFENKIPILSYGFLMLDYFSKNSRIRAQQGGFILFASREKKALPEYLIKKIHIKAEDKANIRKELKNFFNISNAFVYPESNNSVEPFIKSSNKYSQRTELSFEVLLEQILLKLTKELNYKYEIFNAISRDESIVDVDVKKKLFEYEGYIKDLFKDINRSKRILIDIGKEKNINSHIESIEQFKEELAKHLSNIIENTNLSMYKRNIKMSNTGQLTEE